MRSITCSSLLPRALCLTWWFDAFFVSIHLGTASVQLLACCAHSLGGCVMISSRFVPCSLGFFYYLLKAALLAWLVLPQTKVHTSCEFHCHA